MLFSVRVNSVDCSDFPASPKFRMWRHKGVAVAGKSLSIRRGIRESPVKDAFICYMLLRITLTTETLSYNFLPGTREGLQRLGSRQPVRVRDKIQTCHMLFLHRRGYEEILVLNTAPCSVTTLWGVILIDGYFYRHDPAFFMPLHPDLLL